MSKVYPKDHYATVRNKNIKVLNDRFEVIRAMLHDRGLPVPTKAQTVENGFRREVEHLERMLEKTKEYHG